MLRCLASHGVDFIVVGGVGAVLHGAPVATFDLGIVHSQAPTNLVCLLAALKELEACYRPRPDLRPTIEHLAISGHQLLQTKHGPLDVLGMIARGETFDTLLPHAIVMDAGDLRFHVLDLDTLIRTKEATETDKDRPALAALRELRRMSPGS
jgi:hypothetical protein